MKKDYSKKILTIPNALSAMRILLIPFIIAFLFVPERKIVSIVLIFVSALTDIIDGFIARTFGMISDFGRIIDPIADKLTLICIMCALCIEYRLMIALAVILAVKEVTTGILGLFILRKLRSGVNSKWHGKLTTAFIYATMLAHIIFVDMDISVSYVLIGVCLALMIFSFVMYIFYYSSIIRGQVGRTAGEASDSAEESSIPDKTDSGE